MPKLGLPITPPNTATPESVEIVRHSEMADFRQCPLKWWLKWVQQWNPRETSEASTMGTAWHEVMAHHHRFLQQAPPNMDTMEVRRALGPVFDYFQETDFYDRLVWMYDGYLEKYGLDPDWEILEFETTQTVQMMPGVLYEWTTDVLVLDIRLNKIQVVDAKSTKNPLRKIDTDLSDQLGLYVKAQSLRGDYLVMGGITDQARTEKLKRPMTLDERFARIPTYRSAIELDNIWLDAKRTVRKMLEYRESGEIPYSAPDPRICGWKCDFVESHLILRKTPESKWEQRLGPLMRSKGLEQKEVPRGSDRAYTKSTLA